MITTYQGNRTVFYTAESAQDFKEFFNGWSVRQAWDHKQGVRVLLMSPGGELPRIAEVYSKEEFLPEDAKQALHQWRVIHSVRMNPTLRPIDFTQGKKK